MYDSGFRVLGIRVSGCGLVYDSGFRAYGLVYTTTVVVVTSVVAVEQEVVEVYELGSKPQHPTCKPPWWPRI